MLRSAPLGDESGAQVELLREEQKRGRKSRAVVSVMIIRPFVYYLFVKSQLLWRIRNFESSVK
jgi:hypothetical protein